MAHLTNFSFEFVCEIFTEDASLLLPYHGAKKSKMTKNSNQGGPALTLFRTSYRWCSLFHQGRRKEFPIIKAKPKKFVVLPEKKKLEI